MFEGYARLVGAYCQRCQTRHVPFGVAYGCVSITQDLLLYALDLQVFAANNSASDLLHLAY
jgi:hypothetical protein